MAVITLKQTLFFLATLFIVSDVSVGGPHVAHIPVGDLSTLPWELRGAESRFRLLQSSRELKVPDAEEKRIERGRHLTQHKKVSGAVSPPSSPGEIAAVASEDTGLDAARRVLEEGNEQGVQPNLQPDGAWEKQRKLEDEAFRLNLPSPPAGGGLPYAPTASASASQSDQPKAVPADAEIGSQQEEEQPAQQAQGEGLADLPREAAEGGGEGAGGKEGREEGFGFEYDDDLRVRGAEEVEVGPGEEEAFQGDGIDVAKLEEEVGQIMKEVKEVNSHPTSQGKEEVGKWMSGLFHNEGAQAEEEDEGEEWSEDLAWEVDEGGNVVRRIHNRTHAIELLRGAIEDMFGEGGGAGAAEVIARERAEVPWTEEQVITSRGVLRRRKPAPAAGTAAGATGGGGGGAGMINNGTVTGAATASPEKKEWSVSALITVAVATSVGSFLSAMVGFAFALTTTSLLANVLGSKVSQPLVAFLLLVNEIVLIYRKGLGDFREILTLVGASLCTIPVGIMALLWMDAGLGETVLGVLIVAYVLYSLAEFRLPQVESLWQTVCTGLFAGLTIGAFNIGGPWIAIYGQCRRWRADRFASNMLTYQAPTSVFALTIHVFRGAFGDPTLWTLIALATPGMLLGGWAGHHVSNNMPENVFKKVTVTLIGVMGLRLVSSKQSATAGMVTVISVGFMVLGVEWWRRRQERERYYDGDKQAGKKMSVTAHEAESHHPPHLVKSESQHGA